ncbi:MAG: hypothetical protein ACKVJB_07155, partial [Gammaproteobacteria bacterium]
MINKSIKFFIVFLLSLNVFAGGDDRDDAYYENLDQELAAFEAKIAAELDSDAMMAEIEAEMARKAALDAFQQKIEDEKAAAAKSTAAYQSKLANDARIAALMDELSIAKELAAFEAQLAAELASQEMM